MNRDLNGKRVTTTDHLDCLGKGVLGRGNSKYKGPGRRQACCLPGIVGKLELSVGKLELSVGRAVQGEFRVMGRGQALLSLMKNGEESECYY